MSRVAQRQAKQLSGQLDRAFAGLRLVSPDAPGTKLGALVAAEFANSGQLPALSAVRLIPFAAAHGLQVLRLLAGRLVEVAPVEAIFPTSMMSGCFRLNAFSGARRHRQADS